MPLIRLFTFLILPWIYITPPPPTHTSDVSICKYILRVGGGDFTCITAEMFSFGPNPTRAKKAWSSSTYLLYARKSYMTLHPIPSFYISQFFSHSRSLDFKYSPRRIPLFICEMYLCLLFSILLTGLSVQWQFLLVNARQFSLTLLYKVLLVDHMVHGAWNLSLYVNEGVNW
jgi:hypothetical protein